MIFSKTLSIFFLFADIALLYSFEYFNRKIISCLLESNGISIISVIATSQGSLQGVYLYLFSTYNDPENIIFTILQLVAEEMSMICC